jgi:hypothetical protein
MVSRIDVRFIAAGFGNAGLKIIGDDDLGDAAEKGKGTHVGGNPGRQVTVETCLNIRIAAGAKGGHKETGISNPAGDRIRNRHCLAGIIDKEFSPGTVSLPEAYIEFIGPPVVKIAELAVLVPIGMSPFIFIPEELKGDTLLFQVLMDILHGGHRLLTGRYTTCRRIQQMPEGGVIEVFGKGPCKSGYPGTVKIILNGAAGNVTAYGNLADGEVIPPFEPQYFFYLSHG